MHNAFIYPLIASKNIYGVPTMFQEFCLNKDRYGLDLVLGHLEIGFGWGQGGIKYTNTSMACIVLQKWDYSD